MDSVKAIGGWAVVIAAAGAIYWVGNQKKNKNRRTVAPKSTTKAVESRKDTKAKKGKKDVASDQETKQSKRKSTQPSKVEEKAYTTAVDDKVDDEVDNREFARQLSSIKSGTVTAAKTQTSNNRQKSVKQGRAQEKSVPESSDNATAPSSTTGGDADDDESPINSPEVTATPMDPVTNGDVSDMLEKTTSGPQVLKITSPTNPTQAKKAKTAKPAEPQETKKQRQNRQKAEAQRLVREADEKERKVLEEKQRRVAREAEGRAAKDGSTFMASKAPSSSAWTASASNENKETSSNNVELLDTYEPVKPNGTSTAQGKQLADEYNGLSEEEQMRLIQEDSADWMTVSKDKRKKKGPAKESEEGKDEKPAQESKEFGVPPIIAPTGPGQVWNMKTVHVEPETRKVVEREMEVQDSEWEVA